MWPVLLVEEIGVRGFFIFWSWWYSSEFRRYLLIQLLVWGPLKFLDPLVLGTQNFDLKVLYLGFMVFNVTFNNIPVISQRLFHLVTTSNSSNLSLVIKY